MSGRGQAPPPAEANLSPAVRDIARLSAAERGPTGRPEPGPHTLLMRPWPGGRAEHRRRGDIRHRERRVSSSDQVASAG